MADVKTFMRAKDERIANVLLQVKDPDPVVVQRKIEKNLKLGRLCYKISKKTGLDITLCNKIRCAEMEIDKKNIIELLRTRCRLNGGCSGVIKSFDDYDGHGFIIDSATGEEIYCNYANFNEETLGLGGHIYEGFHVLYDVRQTKKGKKAINISIVDEEDIEETETEEDI